ncbi:hypothetical protein AAGS40_27235 (plasmid) [Paraburkholderia sp. PREW-6R]|uniref:hypothetical protein n=1 Tax=Paraburkholderia sp. PREW-6R TaxID=3141544 RepID=UPI0031F4A8FB
MNTRVIGSCAMSIAFLAGCTDLVVSSASPDANADGFVYSLPMGLVYIQASRTKVTQDDVDKAKKAADDAQKAVTQDNGDITAADAAKDPDKKAAAQAKLKQDTDTQKQAQTALTALKVGDLNETVSFTSLGVVADPNARYIGNLNHNWTRDDNMKLSIVKGLLNTSTVTSTDQTPSIIVTLADTAITLGTGLVGAPIPEPAKAAAAVQNCDPFSYAWVFDPRNKEAVDQARQQLTDAGASFNIVVSPDPEARKIPPTPASTQPTQIAGLAYRAAMPVIVTIVKPKADPGAPDTPSKVAPTPPHPADPAGANNSPKPVPAPALGVGAMPNPKVQPGVNPHAPAKPIANNDAKKDANAKAPNGVAGTCTLVSSPPAQAWQIIVPDSTTQYVATSKAGAFTTTTLTYGFTDGMLTDYTMQRPSEVAAIAGIPVRIANDIMTIPTQLLQMRVNYDTASVARINGDVAVKSAQIQQAATLANAETAVVNAQTALSSARIGSSTSIANAQTGLVNALEQLRAARASAASNTSAATSP